MSDWRDKAARNQALFREVNERIEHLAEGADVDGNLGFICECGNPDCAEHIELTHAEYAYVRADASRFALAVGHANLATESIAEQNERFLVVETLASATPLLAPKSNPRSRGVRAGQQTVDGESEESL